MELIALMALTMITLLSFVLVAQTNKAARQERENLIKQIIAKDQDMLDRLMAKDLPEVKQAQKPPAEGVVTSKRRNDQRIAEQNKKLSL